MMNKSPSILQLANKNFINKDYVAALQFYEEFAENNPDISHLVRCNIDLIKKKTLLRGGFSSPHILNKIFSKIYVVNLAKSVDDKVRIGAHLNSRGIKYEFWTAIDGHVGLALEEYKNYEKKPLGRLVRYPDMNDREVRRKGHFIESPGAIGYILTYGFIIKDALKNNYEKILILEDDVILDDNFEHKFESLIRAVSNDWRVIQLGASQYDWSSVDDKKSLDQGFYFPRRIHTCGSFAIGLHKDVLGLLYDAINCYESPFDVLPLGEIYEKFLGKCYVSYPNIVMPDVTSSNIRDGRNQYDHSKKMRWKIENFNFPQPKPLVKFLLKSLHNYKKFIELRKFFENYFEVAFFYFSTDGLRPIHFALGDECDVDLINSEFDSILSPDALDGFLIVDLSNEFSVDGIVKRAVDLVLNYPIISTGSVRGRVSVIVPTYKRSIGLRESSISVLNQDYENIELVIVDDNGDNLEEAEKVVAIVEGLKLQFPQRRLILIKHSKNRNAAAARNTGFYASTGEYVCFLDDDDLYLDGRISKSVSVLNDSPSKVGACYCGFIGWNSPVNDLSRYPSGKLIFPLVSLDYKSHYLHTNTITYRREALEFLNGFDESFKRHQDLELNIRFFTRYEISPLKEALVKLKVNPQDVDNRKVGIEFFKIKCRFLNKFKDVISLLSKEEQSIIYSKHFGEIDRLVLDSDLKSHLGEVGFKIFCFLKFSS